MLDFSTLSARREEAEKRRIDRGDRTSTAGAGAVGLPREWSVSAIVLRRSLEAVGSASIAEFTDNAF
jgi:hypothetical protein